MSKTTHIFYPQNLAEVKVYIEKSIPKALYSAISENNGILYLESNKESIQKLLITLRDNKNTLFKQLIDITAIDYPENEPRFELLYNLLSLYHNLRLVIKLRVSEEEQIPSSSNIFGCANWLEREVFDMYGISFSNHPDLRRILTDYGFEGHPQRKDFPLTGYKQVKYDNDLKQVVYEPVSLSQDFRNFDFLSPWEGSSYVLPGDEKAK